MSLGPFNTARIMPMKGLAKEVRASAADSGLDETVKRLEQQFKGIEAKVEGIQEKGKGMEERVKGNEVVLQGLQEDHGILQENQGILQESHGNLRKISKNNSVLTANLRGHAFASIDILKDYAKEGRRRHDGQYEAVSNEVDGLWQAVQQLRDMVNDGQSREEKLSAKLVSQQAQLDDLNNLLKRWVHCIKND